MSEINYDGLAEPGWRGSQWIEGKNGYAHWEKLTPTQQDYLKKTYAAQSPQEKVYLRDVVIAAIDAYQSAILL